MESDGIFFLLDRMEIFEIRGSKKGLRKPAKKKEMNEKEKGLKVK